MIKLLFTLPRRTIPIYTRGSRSGIAAASVDNKSKSDSDNDTPTVGAWVRSGLEFPIRRVYCVGRNYRAHALEMGGDPDKEPPFFFQKPTDSVVVCHSEATTCLPYPPMTSSLHFEGELIVAIREGGLRIPVDRAMDHVYGYSIGCDLTRRDLQSEAKKRGRPWDTSKGFDRSCPMSPIVIKEDANLNAGSTLRLKVNDSIRQESTIGKMIHSVPEIISNLSQFFRLHPGDLILTGTPAGVSSLNIGDQVSITCGDLIPCKFVMGKPED